MSYASLPEHYPGQYRLDPETGLWVPILSKGKKHPLCQIAFCRRPSEKGAQTGRSTQCGTCRVRLWRANNPIKAHYNAPFYTSVAADDTHGVGFSVSRILKNRKHISLL